MIKAMQSPHALLLIVLSVLTASCQASNGDTYSCMQRWMMQAGIPLKHATTYEATFKQLGISEEKIQRLDAPILGFLMDKNFLNATALKECLGGRKTSCRDYDPCHSNGKCYLIHDQSTYKCNCTVGRKGKFCQHEINWCEGNPCQHGGFCRNHAVNYTCTCAAGFEGASCERKWFRSENYRGVPDKVEQLETALDEVISRTNKLQEKANCPVLGYAYNSRDNYDTDANSGQIALISFTKKQNISHLRLSYSGNVRTNNSPNRAARWFFKINGQECSTPTKVDIAMYQSGNDNTHIPSYLTGICTGTAAGKIAAGQHQITVHVGKLSSLQLADAYSGWASTSFLEVQELCPPF